MCFLTDSGSSGGGSDNMLVVIVVVVVGGVLVVLIAAVLIAICILLFRGHKMKRSGQLSMGPDKSVVHGQWLF